MSDMIEPFADTETDRTKSRWVERVYRSLVDYSGRKRTPQRALYHYALLRNVPDYPICGSFVGEIRVMRLYQESDGEKMPKWINKAIRLRCISSDAIILERPGGNTFIPEVQSEDPYSIEIWTDKSAFIPLIAPICNKYGAILASVDGSPLKEAVEELWRRLRGPKVILCLSDLDESHPSFSLDLAAKIAGSIPAGSTADIKLKCIALLPEQAKELNIPASAMILESNSRTEGWGRYFNKPYHYIKKKLELDCLEVYYPGGIAAFLEKSLNCDYGSDKDSWLLDLKKGIYPAEFIR